MSGIRWAGVNGYDEFGGSIFSVCVHILQVIGDVTGMGYNLANIAIFVFLQPALIIVFWRIEKNKNIRTEQ